LCYIYRALICCCKALSFEFTGDIDPPLTQFRGEAIVGKDYKGYLITVLSQPFYFLYFDLLIIVAAVDVLIEKLLFVGVYGGCYKNWLSRIPFSFLSDKLNFVVEFLK